MQRQPAPGPAAPARTPPAPLPEEEPALANVIRVTDKLISGSAPASDAGFDRLAAMGVRTIISVDGATPDVRRARERGIRYVHLPVGYHGIEPQRRLELARAIRDLPGPIYLHCHHGRHRGPAAAAAAVVALGEFDAAQGVALLEKAGTSHSYAGLYNCVTASTAAGQTQIDAAGAEFSEIAPRPDFVHAMVAMQEMCDRLESIRDAGWSTPAHHPDLRPLAEIGALENLLRTQMQSREFAGRSADFQSLFRACYEQTGELEGRMLDSAPAANLSQSFDRLTASCVRCHALYRDVR